VQTYTVTLDKVIKELGLETIYLPENGQELEVAAADVNRPSLLLAGFTDYFDNRRLQICGRVEISYLQQLEQQEKEKAIESLYSFKPPAVIYTRGLPIDDFAIECGKKYGVPILSSNESTSNFMSAAIAYLNVELAPRITRHGVLVEVYGEGILIMGESGVGKSETAIELLKRGHRLIADDAVDLRRVSNKTIVGTSPENIRHFIELRGVGIVNVRRIFGLGAVKMSEKVNLIVMLEQWDSEKFYSTIDTKSQTMSILDIDIPVITIPIKPGRNLAVIIEVAAMNNRQSDMGYNSAKELLRQLGMDDDLTE
jgi:Serine kinase of the HPr protein, regulates carbohydrate metabolism